MIVRDHHPAIISRQDFDTVQELIKSQKRYGDGRHAHKPWSDHLFRSLIFCDDCGRHMNGTANRTYADGITRSVAYWCPDARRGTCKNRSVQERQISDFVLSLFRNLITANKQFSTIRDTETLEDILVSASTLRSIDHIDPSSISAIWDVLHRFRSDESYQMAGGQPGRKHRIVAPEEEELKKERLRIYKALKRAEDSYLSPDQKRPISAERYQARIDDLQGQIDEIDRKLGRLRTGTTDIVGSEEVWRAMDKLVSMPEIARQRILQYTDYINDLDRRKARTLLESFIDSVRVHDSRITCIQLLDGTSIRFTYTRRKSDV